MSINFKEAKNMRAMISAAIAHQELKSTKLQEVREALIPELVAVLQQSFPGFTVENFLTNIENRISDSQDVIDFLFDHTRFDYQCKWGQVCLALLLIEGVIPSTSIVDKYLDENNTNACVDCFAYGIFPSEAAVARAF